MARFRRFSVLARPVLAPLAVSFLILPVLVRAETVVSGNVSVAWTKAASPYRVTATVTVPTGQTLTIEPGVDVLFDADVAFRVEGSLLAIGTAADSIRFLASAQNDSAGWGGIRIIGGDSSVIAYARISDGNPDGVRENEKYGGAIAVEGAQLGLFHVVMRGNRAERGGAVAATHYRAFTEVIPVADTSRVTLEDCTIADNVSEGGGIYADHGAVLRMVRCVVERNVGTAYIGSAVWCNAGTLDMDSCAVRNNAGYEGGGVSVNNGTGMIRNCLIAGNTAGFGAGMYIRYATVTIENCTIGGNRAMWGGGGVYVSGPPTIVDIRGSIVWDNTNGNVANAGGQESGTIRQSYSLTATDPLFADTLSYALAPGSPAIDAGSPYGRDADGTRSDIGWTGGRGTPPAIPRIDVPVTTVIVATNETKPLVIRNTGWTDLAIANIAFSTGFSTLLAFPRIVSPGDSLVVLVVFAGASTPGTVTISHSDTWQDAIVVPLSGVAGTGVSGDVSGVWTKADNPYRVTGPIIVPAGDTLSIEPGVDVQFDADVSLVVLGCLKANGTASEVIQFHHSGTAGPWRGLRFLGGDSSTVTYARIMGARAWDIPNGDYYGGGILVDGSRLELANSTIVGNAANYGGGLYATGGARVAISGCTLNSNDRNAVEVDDSSRVAITGCHFYGNAGNVIEIYGASTVTMTRCTIARHNQGPQWAVIVRESALDMRDCIIEENGTASNGGGMWAMNSTVRVTGGRFTGNAGAKGGAIYADACTLAVTGCTISRNRAVAFGGGLYLVFTIATIVDCVIGDNVAYVDGNSAETGGGISVEKGSTAITGCTIAGNTAAYGGGISGSAPIMTLKNTIVWGNTPEGIVTAESASIAATWSTIQGGWPGEGNLATDPQFENAAALDFRLKPASVCIDAGDPTMTNADGSRADIGAIPYLQTSAVAPVVAPPVFALSPNAPNPFNPSTIIRFSLAQPGDTRLAIYDVNGRLVRALVDGSLAAGAHEVAWDGRDATGRRVASGIYVYRLVAKDGVMVRRMALLR